MTDAEKIAEYREAVHACTLVATLLRAHDVPALLQAIDRASAVGHILDPTLYREQVRAMLEDREVLAAALPLWRIGGKLEELGRARATSAEGEAAKR